MSRTGEVVFTLTDASAKREVDAALEEASALDNQAASLAVRRQALIQRAWAALEEHAKARGKPFRSGDDEDARSHSYEHATGHVIDAGPNWGRHSFMRSFGAKNEEKK